MSTLRSFVAAGLALSALFGHASPASAEPMRLSPREASKSRPIQRDFWFGLLLQQDAAFVGGSDVCTKDSQLNQGFSCFRSAGSQYHGTPRLGVLDAVGSGVLPATTRLNLTADVLVAEDLALGARVGWVLRGGGPTPDGGKPFKPFHAEARLSYFVAGPAFAPDGFSPYLFAAGGVMQIDAHIGVDVAEDPSAPPPPNQPDNPPQQHLDAYKKMGYSFVGAGAGAYLPVSEASGARLELGFLGLFPSNGAALYLGVGWVFGV